LTATTPRDALGRPLPTRERRQTVLARRTPTREQAKLGAVALLAGRADSQREQRVSINARDLKSM
jgi:hypothetical protein